MILFVDLTLQQLPGQPRRHVRDLPLHVVLGLFPLQQSIGFRLPADIRCLFPGFCHDFAAPVLRQAGLTPLRLFECGKTYHLNPQTASGEDVTVRYQERDMMSMFVTGKLGDDDWKGKAGAADFFYLRNMIDNFLLKVHFPMERMELVTNDEPRMFAQHIAYKIGDAIPVRIGVLRADILNAFDIKKSVCYAEIDMRLLNEICSDQSVFFQPINIYPAVRRDLALVVNKDVTYDQLERIARKYASKLLKQVSLFDVYEGTGVEEGKKSYALNFVLQNADKTLTDEDINKVMNKLISAYEREVGAKLR